MTVVHPLVPGEQLRGALTDEARHAFDDMRSGVAGQPATLGRVFPASARQTARGELDDSDVRIEDAVRVELVAAAASGLTPSALLEELGQIYRYGDGDEKRAVLLALSATDDPQVDGSTVLLDALRTNDVRLVAVAMGPHASRLSAHDWRHGVLKCLFVGVPLQRVSNLAGRADPELTAMVRRYVEERVTAGREVPDDAFLVLDLTAQDLSTTHDPTQSTGLEG